MHVYSLAGTRHQKFPFMQITLVTGKPLLRAINFNSWYASLKTMYIPNNQLKLYFYAAQEILLRPPAVTITNEP